MLNSHFWGRFHRGTDLASEGCCVNWSLLQKEPAGQTDPLKSVGGCLGSQQWNLSNVASTHSLYITHRYC